MLKKKSCSILVLKDGQIAEQGSHKELLAHDGIFASMWADQVSSAEDAAASMNGDPSKKDVEPEWLHPNSDEVTGYQVPDVQGNEEQPKEQHERGITFPSSDTEVVGTAENAEPVQFPANPVFPADQVQATPVEFPSSNDAPSEHRASLSASPSPTPAVTFDANLSSPPRTGTPDAESEPKRKRISSQNFQRLARRISITAKRQSSSFIPGIPGLRKDSSPRVSVDDNRPEGTESPSGSIKNDDKGKRKKKERKPTA